MTPLTTDLPKGGSGWAMAFDLDITKGSGEGCTILLMEDHSGKEFQIDLMQGKNQKVLFAATPGAYAFSKMHCYGSNITYYLRDGNFSVLPGKITHLGHVRFDIGVRGAAFSFNRSPVANSHIAELRNFSNVFLKGAAE